MLNMYTNKANTILDISTTIASDLSADFLAKKCFKTRVCKNINTFTLYFNITIIYIYIL